jgi:hypothetical protein
LSRSGLRASGWLILHGRRRSTLTRRPNGWRWLELTRTLREALTWWPKIAWRWRRIVTKARAWSKAAWWGWRRKSTAILRGIVAGVLVMRVAGRWEWRLVGAVLRRTLGWARSGGVLCRCG